LPEGLRNLPLVVNKGKKGRNFRPGATDDNSNTQFALLALWTARRHDVPTEKTLELAEERFRATQNTDGGWGYMAIFRQNSTAAMTCVGLLGLAMGHGASEEAMQAAAKKVGNLEIPKTDKEDPAIRKGLKRLGQSIEKPYPPKSFPPIPNLYDLWSVER